MEAGKKDRIELAFPCMRGVGTKRYKGRLSVGVHYYIMNWMQTLVHVN